MSPEIRVTDRQLNQHPYRPLLPAATKLLGATSLEEQVFCEWYAAHGLAGHGVVVELGPWLGSLTIPTARGLAANPVIPRSRRRIHAFDLYLWHEGLEGWVAGTAYAGRCRPGESFLPLYREIVASYENDATIIAHQEDLIGAEWTGEPVEFLINDAWKQLPVMANVIAQFFPSLVSGAILFHQDYLWASDSFIHVGMYRLREYFQFVCRLDRSCTALFRKVGEIPASVLAEVAARRSYEDFSEVEVHAAFDWSRALFADPEARLIVDAGRAWMLVQMGHVEAAREIFAQIKRSSDYQHPFYQFQEGVLKQWGLAAVIGED